MANAYGSMPHKKVLEMLERDHVPASVRDLILAYYSNFSLRVSARSVTSDWHRLEVGIIPGCTISVILFALLHHLSQYVYMQQEIRISDRIRHRSDF